MNVFQLKQGATLTTVSAQLLRMAPRGANICVLEAIGDPTDEKLAADVANLLASSRSSEIFDRTCLGYQIGALPDFRNTTYKLYFIG